MIREQIKERVRKLSEEIHAMKAKAAKFEERRVWDPAKRYWVYDESKATWAKQRVQVQSISPSHEDWPSYVMAKRNVSLLLTALSIVKEVGEDPEKIKNLTKDDIRSLLEQKKLRGHAKRPSSIAFGALRWLKKKIKEQPAEAIPSAAGEGVLDLINRVIGRG